MVHRSFVQYLKTHPTEFKMLLLLSSMQFFHTLDFVVMMPLGPSFMRDFKIGPQEFGLLVSAYMYSASLAGFIGSNLVDRFDRKRVLLFLYLGFILGTALCAFSPNHHVFLIARLIAGGFAGLMMATVFSIVGDTVPEIRRGQAMGIVMSSFAVASVVGVPIGIGIANFFEWHATFLAIAIGGSMSWVFGALRLPSVVGHLQHPKRNFPLFTVLSDKRNYFAFTFMFVLMIAGFTVIPYLAPYFASNAGVNEKNLFYIYLVGGSVTFFSGPFIGRLADKYGKRRVFQIIALVSVIPIAIVTNLQTVPMAVALLVSTFFMVFVSGRFVPAMALLTSSIPQRIRGSFMSVNNSLQNLSAAAAASFASSLLSADSSGRIIGYNRCGYVAIFATCLAVVLSTRVRSEDESKSDLSISTPSQSEIG